MKQPVAQALAREQRGDHPRRRGLAVGADDVDRRERQLRGSSSTFSRRRIRSRPKRMPKRSRESRWRSASSALQTASRIGCCELTAPRAPPERSELLALAGDDLGRRVGDERRVGELALEPRDLARRASRARARGAASCAPRSTPSRIASDAAGDRDARPRRRSPSRRRAARAARCARAAARAPS